MPQLRSCYFCGAVGESLREYEVVPPRLAPTPDGARSAVLCTTCREKLRRVMDPLVARIDGDEAPTPANAAPSPDAASATAGATQDVTFEGPRDDGGAEGATAADSPVGDASDATPDDADDGDAATADTADDSGGDAATDATEDDADATEDDAATDAEPAVPDGYYKVLRLLENREFPVERSELVALVTGAYDMDETQCERILSTAVDRGILVESGTAYDVGRD